MRQKGRKNRLLVKHILSFLMILVTVAVLVVVLFEGILAQNLNTFNDQQQQNVLESSIDNLHREQQRIQRIINQMLLYKEMNPARIQKNAYYVLDAQNVLRELAQTDEYVEDILLVSGKYEFAISNVTSYPIEYFRDYLDADLFADCETYGDVVEALKKTRAFPLRYLGNEQMGFVFGYDIYGSVNNSMIVVTVSTEKLIELLKEPLSDTTMMKGLLYLGDEILSTDPELGELPRWEELGSQITLKGQDFRVITMDRQEEGMTKFAYLVDNAFYERPIVRTTHQFLFWLLMIFILGTFGIVIFSYYIYKPVARVQQRLEGYLENKPDKKQNELHYIASGIDQLIEENIRLSKQVNVDSRMLRNFCLFKLLHNPNPNMESVRRSLKEVGIRMDRELFQCISVSLIDTADVEKFAKRIEQERESQSPYYILYYVINGSSFVLIFNYDQKDREMMEYLLENFSQFYVREIRMNMGVGSVVSGLQKLQDSYNQSQMAMHYAETNEELKLSSFGDMQLNTNIEKIYSTRQMDLLLAAIQKNNREEITAELEKLKAFIRESRMPRYVIKAVYYEIVNGILSRSRNPILFEKGNEILMAIGSNLQKSSLDQVYDQIEALCYQMVDQTSGVVLLDKILDYITQNYGDPNFSISAMAEHFAMSHQSMSNLFKKEMHLTLIEYITQCKISAAVDMLTHTNLPISEIVRRIGYTDNSSFTRKFKAAMGMPPAEYRRTFSHPHED